MKVKELMVPVSEYTTVGMDATLGEVATALADCAHRDILVVNQRGAMEGILTMTDMLMALEPNYKKISRKALSTDTLSKSFVNDLFKEFGLWSNTLGVLCKDGCEIKVADVMHVPGKSETVTEEDDLAYAIHLYIVGSRQPIIVKSNGTVTGILRLSDIFNEVTRRMVECTCSADGLDEA